MSHKHFDERIIKDATPEKLREELDTYFAHVQQHDPKSLEFALMAVGHGESDGGTRVCSMVGGPPQTIVRIIIELMDELTKRNPAFAALFLINFMQRIGVKAVDTSKFDFDNIGGADTEAQVKDLINRLRGDTPSDGSVH